MKIESGQTFIIYKNEYNGKELYSIALSRKDRDGAKFNGYLNCQFKKGVSLENKSKIKIKNAFITFYLKDKQTIPYVMITDFDYVVEENLTISGKFTQAEYEDMLPF